MLIKSIPKVELHVHLEACVSGSLINKLSGSDAAIAFRVAKRTFGARIPYDFDHFVNLFRSTVSSIRSVDDLVVLLEHALHRQKEANVIYSEFTFTPAFFKERFGWSPQTIADRFVHLLV